jgi:hypothetical protein
MIAFEGVEQGVGVAAEEDSSDAGLDLGPGARKVGDQCTGVLVCGDEARDRTWRALRIPLGSLAQLELGLGRQPDPHRSTRGSRGLACSGDDGIELVLDELGGDGGRPTLADGLQAALGFGDPARFDVRGGLLLDAVGEDGGDGNAIVLRELQQLVQEVLGVGRHGD